MGRLPYALRLACARMLNLLFLNRVSAVTSRPVRVAGALELRADLSHRRECGLRARRSHGTSLGARARRLPLPRSHRRPRGMSDERWHLHSYLVCLTRPTVSPHEYGSTPWPPSPAPVTSSTLGDGAIYRPILIGVGTLEMLWHVLWLWLWLWLWNHHHHGVRRFSHARHGLRCRPAGRHHK
jgi:hypothetical protein